MFCDLWTHHSLETAYTARPVAAQRGRDPQIYVVMNISNGRDALRGLAT
jgi:hypothetical protein